MANKKNDNYIFVFHNKSICLFTFSQLFVYRYRKGDNDEDIMTEYKSIMASNTIPNNAQVDDTLIILNSDTNPEEPIEEKYSKIKEFAKRENMKPFCIVITLLGMVPLTGIYRYLLSTYLIKLNFYFLHT